MGFSVGRFTSAVDENLLCSICSCVLEDAVLTPCGHCFCQLCLHTWIQARGAGPPTCPACRGRLGTGEQGAARPVLALRSLIAALPVHCLHRHRGCRAVTKLEAQPAHLENCDHTPVECAGCGEVVNRGELAEHHLGCDAIAAALREEEELLTGIASGSLLNESGASQPGSSPIAVFNLGLSCQGARLSQSKSNLRQNITGASASSSSRYQLGPYAELAELSCRVASLELQLTRMKRDLDNTESKNRKLQRELNRASEELHNNNYFQDRAPSGHSATVEFDPDYEYGFTASSVPKLSGLISRFLVRKPDYICRDRIFNAIQRCYDNFCRAGAQHEQHVHMLVATASASSWFSETQRLKFHLWLQTISRRRQFQHISDNVQRDMPVTSTTINPALRS